MENYHPLDSFFMVPIEGLRFLGFECVIGLFSSLIISVASFVYLALHPGCYICDKPMSSWLFLIGLLRLIDVPIKLLVLCKIYSLSKKVNHEDRRIMTRRLMDLVRGRLYRVQKYSNGMSYLIVSGGVVKIINEPNCNDSHFYQFCISVVMTFTVRLIVGIASYKYEEKKVINRGMGEFIQFFKNGATLNDIEKVQLLEINSENIRKIEDICAVCTEEFCVKDLVRVLPCNNSHSFHRDCIDRWLIQKDACPLCGVSIKTR